MLQIKELTIIHKKDLMPIIEGFNYVLNPGDKTVLIGEEGNGKSTLLKWIYEPEFVEDYTEAKGERIFHGEILGYLPQEIPKEQGQLTIYEFLSEQEWFWDVTPKEAARIAGQLQLDMDMFYSDQKIYTLSGGEKIKIQIAKLLMQRPTVLLMDEPSNDLDIETLEWLEQWISKSELSFLFISHDETFIERTATSVIHLEQIRRKTKCRYTVAKMSYAEYLRERKMQFGKQEDRAISDKKKEQIQRQKFLRIQQKVENAQNKISRQDPHGAQMLKKKMRAVKSMEKRYDREQENKTEMPEEEQAIFLEFNQNIHIPAGKVVLEYKLEELVADSADNSKKILARDIFLQIRGQEKICIVGKNGAGKTTLIKRIAEEMLKREDIKAAYMPQNYYDILDGTKTPVEFLSVTGEKEEITRIRTYLGSMKYTADEMNHPVEELSGGQKAKILLLKMSMSGAEVLILDEPTRNFSPLSNPVIREVLKRYRGAIICISHDRKFIHEVCDRVYTLGKDGLSL